MQGRKWNTFIRQVNTASKNWDSATTKKKENIYLHWETKKWMNEQIVW